MGKGSVADGGIGDQLLRSRGLGGGGHGAYEYKDEVESVHCGRKMGVSVGLCCEGVVRQSWHQGKK